jgi:hypothetical protein
MDLKTSIWAAALVRRAESGGAFAAIVRRGDNDAGALLVKVATMDRKARLYAPARDGQGARIWLDLSSGPLGCDEAAVDAHAAKRVQTDPDVWIVEIEDRAGRHFLTEPVAKG